MPQLHMLGRRSSCALALICSTAVSLPALAGTVRRVPQDHATIQAAINAAVPGDTVLVAGGVYSGAGNRDLDLMGKAITVRSATGASSCTIVAGGTSSQYHTGFISQHNETAASVIEGFTITGGHQFNGGAVMVLTGAPTVRNCIMTGNLADCWGAAVYVQSGGSPRFVNCKISGNSSADEGGGIFLIGTGSPTFEGCVIADNTALDGGGICTFQGQPVFTNCRITGNTASYYGGAATMYGGRFVNCTMAGNSAAYEGSGVYAYSGVPTTITNSIVWGNSGADQLSGQPVTSYSIVQGGSPGIGNRVANPLFVNPLAGDYRIADGSPAIDAGSNFAVPAGILVDLGGAPRFLNDPRTIDAGVGAGAIVDIGAFEFRRSVMTKLVNAD